MNGTIIDVQGLSVNVSTVSLEHSTDKATTIELKDSEGLTLTVTVAFGKITSVNQKIK
jgi:hypothetical protein